MEILSIFFPLDQMLKLSSQMKRQEQAFQQNVCPEIRKYGTGTQIKSHKVAINTETSHQILSTVSLLHFGGKQRVPKLSSQFGS